LCCISPHFSENARYFRVENVRILFLYFTAAILREVKESTGEGYTSAAK